MHIGGRKGHFDYIQFKNIMTVKGTIVFLRGLRGKQLEDFVGSSLCVLLQSNSAELDSLGGGTWVFASMDLPARKFGTSLCVAALKVCRACLTNVGRRDMGICFSGSTRAFMFIVVDFLIVFLVLSFIFVLLQVREFLRGVQYKAKLCGQWTAPVQDTPSDILIVY